MQPSGFLSSLVQPNPEELAARQRGVMRTVYAGMTVALFITAFVAFVTINVTPLLLLVANQPVLIGLMIVQLVLVLGLSWGINRLPLAVSLLGFLVYSVVMGLMLSVILLGYTAGDVTAAFLSTSLLFAAMSILGYTTKYDLTRLGGFLIMGLIGLIIGSIINLFLASDALDWILTYAGIAIFIGLTAYDTQRIKTMTAEAVATGQSGIEWRVGLRGALILYLDFINLFLRILRLFRQR